MEIQASRLTDNVNSGIRNLGFLSPTEKHDFGPGHKSCSGQWTWLDTSGCDMFTPLPWAFALGLSSYAPLIATRWHAPISHFPFPWAPGWDMESRPPTPSGHWPEENEREVERIWTQPANWTNGSLGSGVQPSPAKMQLTCWPRVWE